MKAFQVFALTLLICFLTTCEDGEFSEPSDNDKTDSKSAEAIMNEERVGCNKPEEEKLIGRLRDYREQNGLPKIPVSQSLTEVADIHVRDLSHNGPHEESENCNLHSWSESGKWVSCCYTPDHDQAGCMWDKPEELTDYDHTGYEIAFGRRGESYSPKEALESWQNSSAHNNVIINEGKWENYEWDAMGVGNFNGFWVVWFGRYEDPGGKPSVCN